MPTSEIPGLVKRLYEIVEELERHFPGRHFTPDGHMVGSLGEVWAAHRYGLQLAAASTEGHDGKCPAGHCVQVKATQGTSVALSSEPEWLIVLKLGKDGTANEVYNGPGAPVWAACGKVAKNGQRRIRLSTLRSSWNAYHRRAVFLEYPETGDRVERDRSVSGPMLAIENLIPTGASGSATRFKSFPAADGQPQTPGYPSQ